MIPKFYRCIHCGQIEIDSDLRKNVQIDEVERLQMALDDLLETCELNGMHGDLTYQKTKAIYLESVTPNMEIGASGTVSDGMKGMDWEELSIEISRVAGIMEGGFSQGGKHPWIISVVRLATLKERRKCVETAEAAASDFK